MIKSSLFTTLLLQSTLCFASTEKPLPVEINQGVGAVRFLATGKPSALKIRGEGSAPTGALSIQDKILSGEVRFALDSLKTGIELRDKHMKEKYLEVAQHPYAVLKVSDTALDEQVLKSLENGCSDLKDKKVKFAGTLTLHGVEQKIAGDLQAKCANKDIHVAASFPLKLSDYKVSIPEYLGIKIAESVAVEVEMEVKRAATVSVK